MTDKTDVVERLRKRLLKVHGGSNDMLYGWNLTLQDSEMHRDAIAEITRLRAEVARLEAVKAEVVNRYKPDAERWRYFWASVTEAGGAKRTATIRSPFHEGDPYKLNNAIDTAMRGDREDG